MSIGRSLIGFWNGVIRTFATAYAYSYFFTCVTGIYLLLRHDVDAASLDQVFIASPQSTLRKSRRHFIQQRPPIRRPVPASRPTSSQPSRWRVGMETNLPRDGIHQACATNRPG